MESHTIANAVKRGELTEDEAYFILRFAGRMGYDNAIKKLTPWHHRLRQWFLWIGGWECPELMQWDAGRAAFEPRRPDGRWRSPYPVTILNRVTLFGGWGQVRVGRGFVTWVSRDRMLYWSPDGTPSNPAARFLIGRARP